MEDEEFLERLRAKIAGRTGAQVHLELDKRDPWTMSVKLDEGGGKVTLGAGVLRYPGFARMCMEYAVACIRARREITPLEFHVLLQRN